MKQKQQLEERIKLAQSATQLQLRKDDARRKILIGAYVLDKYNSENKFDELIHELDQFLFRPTDRILFDLPPRVENAKAMPEGL